MTQPKHMGPRHMKFSRLAAFTLAAAIGISALGPSAHAGFLGDIAEAGVGAIKRKVAGPDYSWMGNRQYMDCIKYVGAYGPDYPGRDQNIRACQRQYLR
jgi:hypothetical protein